MDFANVGRNDPCPCGSGKKFKKCHMGRESEIIEDKFSPDPGQAAQAITRLPPADHPRAREMAAQVEITSATGRKIEIKLVDLDAYRELGLGGRPNQPEGGGGVLINPTKTRALDPNAVYIALSPDVDDSTIVHQLAHAVDLIQGSRIPVGYAAELAGRTGVPAQLLEHPQPFGDILLDLAQRLEVELDAEDEIVAFLARREMLLTPEVVIEGKKEALVAAAEKTMRALKENQDEIDARIRARRGYIGKKGE